MPVNLGGPGYDWFTVELATESVGGPGNDWFQVDLDTTAPHVTFGVPLVLEQGKTLSLPYDADEMVLRAFLVAGDRRLPFEFSRGYMVVDVPTDWPAGPAGVEVVDDVLNVRAYAGVLTFPGVVEPPPEPEPQPEPEPRPEFGGIPGQRIDIWTDQLEGEILDDRLEGELVHAQVDGRIVKPRRVETVVFGTVARAVVVTAQIEGAVSAQREIFTTLEGAREPAFMLAQQVREDDELLALLSAVGV